MQARPASLDSIAISDDAGQVPIYSRKKAMRYPGGKGGAGVYQTIINNIPPHDTYIETHLGGGNILERKRPAARSVGIDVDPEVIEVWQQLDVPGLELHHGDAVAWLESHQFTGSEFVYADPPYVMDSRRGGKLYCHEYDDKGAVSVKVRGEAPIVYLTGQTFYQPKSAPDTQVVNASKTDAAKVISFRLSNSK
jgi:hypothetical protein